MYASTTNISRKNEAASESDCMAASPALDVSSCILSLFAEFVAFAGICEFYADNISCHI